jgi:uncharacterized protein YndB with AHSA1/START domain
MSKRTVTHDTFSLERVYAASPARVFAAWSQPQIKARWFGGPEEWGPDIHEIDFRVGGHETSRGGPKNGPVHYFNALYQNIVPDERIIYSYEMFVDDVRLSISLTTVEFVAEGKATRLIFTEQGAYLDGHENPAERKRGTEELLDALGLELQRQAATA